MIDLSAALSFVVGALESVDANHVVVGSGAAAAWGVTRSTRDIDLVTVIRSDAADALLHALERDDLYVPMADARDAIASGSGSFNVLHPATGGKVDVFVAASDDEFERSRLVRRVRADVFGVSAWIATPEDVVLAKLRWRLGSRSEVQWRDCVEIAATQSLDGDYLRSWASHLGVAADLDELLTPS